MRNKTPLIWLTAGLVTALAIIFSGCSTEKPWATNANIPLTLSLISGPADAAEVPADATISYTWSAIGGSGQILYQYRLNDGTWTEPADVNTATFTGLMPDSSYTFAVQAKDGAGRTVSVSRNFTVGEAAGPPPPDTIPPYVEITASPAEGSFMATGSVLTFTWTGYDSLGSGADLLFQYTFAGATSEWLPIRTITFSNVAALDPAVFTVAAKDQAGNVSEVASVTFVIKNASVLYVDDYVWLDSFGNVDRAKEREQKDFYREALRGYAFAEWDNDAMGHVPTMNDLAGFTTIIWAADADNACSADPNYRLWFDIGAEGGGVLKEFMDGGGHLLITGSQVLPYLYNSNPPGATDFEAAYLGVSDTMIAIVDTTVTPPETTYATTWVESLSDYGYSDFTWAIKAEGSMLDLPDSMKIDVAKNGDQLACVASLIYLKSDDVPLFTVGLDVYGDPPENYGMVTGWIYEPDGNAISASLMFDTFSMPLPGIRQTFHTILNQFGEGQGL